MKFAASLVLSLAVLCRPGMAQVPDTLLHALFSPANTPQASVRQGESVAVDGNLAVSGIPNANTSGTNAGAAKVYDAASGALLHFLVNPAPATNDNFGYSVAISGTLIVVGAYGDATSGVTAGSAYVYDLGSSTPAIPVTTLPNPEPNAGDSFGYSVGIDGTRVVVGAYLDDTGASNTGSAYVFDLTSGTPAEPVAILHNPGPASGDNFGKSVAISGTRVAVAAWPDDTGGTDAGSVYVYDLNAVTPTAPVATLQKPVPAASDFFGTSVAISGTRVVVGAFGDDTGPAGPGRAYVFDLSNGTPTTPVAALNNPGPAASDRFGWSVAISGTRVLVGDWADDTGANGAGRAYFYHLESGTPSTPVVMLDNPGPGTGDRFGTAVAISGTRAVVGVSWDDNIATDAGGAFAYDLSSGTPAIPVATLSHPVPGFGDNFGNAVAVSGSLMVVGSYQDDTGAASAGSAYVFDLSSGTPTVPVATLHNPTPAANDWFGWSVGISGTRVVVGAMQDDAGAMNSGSAYVYDLSSSTPAVPAITLTNPGPAASDNFGRSVAISGMRVIVAANRDDTAATDAGSVYVYDLSGSTPDAPVFILVKPGAAATDFFGWSVAMSGTLAVVGSFLDDTGGLDAGSAYVYDLNSAAPTVPFATLSNPEPAASDGFGGSVAISGMRVAVGAANDDTGASNAGSAYLYDLGSGTPAVPVTVLNNPAAAADDNFGWSVSIDGARVVASAYRSDVSATDAGIAYVYDLNSGTPHVPVAALGNPSPAAGDNFGSSVAISSTRVLAGTRLDDTAAPDKGAAYVFVPAAEVPPPAPEIAVEQPAGTDIAPGSERAFPKAELGSTSTLTFTVRNAGTSELTGLSLTKAPDGNPGDFLLGTLDAATLAPQATATFTMTFAPTAASQRTALIRIASNDGDENPFEIHLVGNGPPDIAVALPDGTGLADGARAIDFGFLTGGANASRSFIIRNTGTLDLTGLAISFDGADAADFSVSATPAPALPAGNSTAFTVRFAPTTAGTKAATLHIASNDPDENPFDIAVYGEADADSTPETATALPHAGTGTPAKITADIFPAGDVDYYSFSAQAGDRVYAAVTTSFSSDSADSELRIIGTDGATVLEFDDDDGPFSSSSIAGATIPATGTWFVKVNAKLVTSTIRPYDLWLQIRSSSPAAESEPNDASPQALPAPGWMAGSLSSVTDLDHFNLSLQAGDTVFLSLDMDPERDGTTWDGLVGLGVFGNPANFLVSSDPGVTSPNSEAFTMTVKDAGTYTVRIAAASGGTTFGTWHLNVSVRPAPSFPATTYVSASVPQTIPDGPGVVTSSLTIPHSKRIGRLRVLLNLTHTNMPDLDVSLTAPDGNTVMLFTDVGGSDQTAMDLGLDDDAAIPVSSYTVKSRIIFQPESGYRLGWFKGQQAQGTWTLTIRDDTAANGGTLNNWSLVVIDEDAVPGGIPATHFSSDFEVNDGGFGHTGTADEWQRGLPAFPPVSSANSGSHCWKTDLTGTYNSNSSQDLFSPAIDLTGVAAGHAVIATWAMKYQMGFAGSDNAYVEVQQVGGPEDSRKVWEWLGPEMTDISFGGTPLITTQEAAGWGLHRVDIREFAGKTIRLRFHVDSNATTELAGMAIDDVSVISYAPAPLESPGTGVKVTGDIFPAGDVDYYSFTAQAGDRVYAAVMTSFSAGSGDSELSIIGTDGTTLLEYDDEDGSFGTTSSSIAGVLVPAAGTCFVRVNAKSPAATIRPYDLWLRVQSGNPVAESEPNDSHPGPALPAAGHVSGSLSSAADLDFYSIGLNAGDTVFVSLDCDPERDGTTWDASVGIGRFGIPLLRLTTSDESGTSPNAEALFMTVKEAGTYAVSVSVPAGGATFGTYHLCVTVRTASVEASTVYASTDVPEPVPDGPDMAISTLTIPDYRRIGKLKVFLDLTHTSMPDLDVSLTAPDGNTVGLFNDTGASTQTALNLVLDDEAGIPVSFYSVKSGIVFQPEAAYRLDWFKGQQAQGTWTLTIRDDAAGNGGTLNGWSLEVVDEDPLPGGVSEVIYSNDFETDDGGFTHTGAGDEWQRGLPAFAPIISANSGTNCWKTDLTGAYQDNCSQDLYSPPVDLPAIPPGGTVMFSWAMKYQLGSAHLDGAYVEVEEVGGAGARRKVWEWLGAIMTISEGEPAVTTHQSAGWGLHRADISEFAGKTVRLRFHLHSDASVNLAGLAVDDVAVTSWHDPSPLESWRLLHFGNAGNTGNAADTFDFDRDGLANLVEYAFGLDPTSGSSLQLPEPQNAGNDRVITFPQPAGVTGVTYRAEWSPSLSGPWTPISDTGTGLQHTFVLPVGGANRLFFRIIVTAP